MVLPGTRGATAPAMPTARYGLAAALGKDGRIYLLGGINSAGAYVTTAEAYDVAAQTFSSLSSSFSILSVSAFFSDALIHLTILCAARFVQRRD